MNQFEFQGHGRDLGTGRPVWLKPAVVPGGVSLVAMFVGLLVGIAGLVLLIACLNVAG